MVIQAADAAARPQRVFSPNLKALALLRGAGNTQLIGRVQRRRLVHGNRHHANADVLAAALFGEDVYHGHVLQNLHVRQAAHSGEERLRDLFARNVCVIANARAGVRPLTREVERAICLALKARAQR